MNDKKEEIVDKIVNPHDKVIRFFFDENETAKSFFQEYLPPRITENLALDSLEISKDTFISPKMSDYFSDILYYIRLNNMDAYIYLLIDHKSWEERFMGLQLLKYMVRIWELYLKQNKNVEILPVILPIVIYNGPTKWRVNTSFVSLFNASENVKDYIPNFNYNLHDISHIPDEEIRGVVLLRILFKTFKYIYKPELRHKLPEILRLFSELKDKSRTTEYLEVLLRYVSSSARDIEEDELKETVIQIFERGGDLMATIAEKWLAEGKKEGKEEITWNFVRNSLKEGLPIKTIERITGLPIEKINHIKEKMAAI